MERDHKRYRSRSPPSSSTLKETQKKYRQMNGNDERNGRSDGGRGDRGRNEGDGGRGRDGGGDRGRGGRGGFHRRGGRGNGDDDDHRKFVDLRVNGLKKKTIGVNFQLDTEVGEPESSMESIKADDVVITEENLQEIEEFLLNEEETEEERELRLIEERRKRREEILKKHASESSIQETMPEAQPVELNMAVVKDDDDDDKVTAQVEILEISYRNSYYRLSQELFAMLMLKGKLPP